VIPAELAARAEKWIDGDPSKETQDELRALLAQNDEEAAADLRDRFSGPLQFGTAGLRGVIGAGESRMNRAVVLRTTHGFARALLQAIPDAKTRGVVVGFDGRRMSRQFAEDTACVLAASGVRAHLFRAVCPTPVASFAVKHLGAAAGVMVTASHNPPEYNGYKVYWDNSAQIIPPVDATIARAIDEAPVAKDVPRAEIEDARAKDLVVDVPAATIDAYRAAIDALRFQAGATAAPNRDLGIVYTAMHGVGNAYALGALSRAGFTRVFSVPEQAEPDGSFPTVAFPNPEEEGAMDLAFAHARERRADLVLANDPDADRLAVAIPHGSGDESAPGYLQLTGNQVGVLLGHHLLVRGPKREKPLVIASLVSSPELGNIARALGVRYEETLTGFKWIANRAMDLERTDGAAFVFGYEEALGYTVGDVVRDKDGVSAALMFAELAAYLAAEGRTVHDELEAIARRFGLFMSAQVNVVRKGPTGPAEIAAVMNSIRTASPKTLGPFAVTAKADFATGARGLPKANMVVFDLEGGSRVIARPSGTEPKVKLYFDVADRIADGERLDAAETRVRARMKALQEAFAALAGA
jgi:phosphomannomutase